MNFKMKTLAVAAITAMAMSGAANAAISNSAGGELFVMAYDSVSTNTFIGTLDSIVSTAAAFTGTSNLSKSFAGDANWTAFSSAASFNATNVTYQVLGEDTTSTSLWTTSTNMPAGSAGNNANYANISAPTGFVTQWLAGYTGAAGSSTALVPLSQAFGTAPQMGNQWSNNLLKFTTTAALGSDDSFYKLGKNGTNPINVLTKTTYLQADGVTNGVWNLSSAGTLTYTAAAVAAVPEADTWAMMLAGLGLMGFIARRRTV